MTLTRRYDNLEDIPEILREYYVEQNGAWVLDAEPGEGERHARDVQAALKARDNEKAERAKLSEQLQSIMDSLGDRDISELPDALKALGELESQQDQNGESHLVELRQAQRDLVQAKRALEQKDAAIANLEQVQQTIVGRMSELTIDNSLTEAFNKAGTDPAKLPFLLKSAREGWELDENHNPVPIVWQDGTKITATGADGQPISMDTHVQGLLAENQWALLPSNGSGARHQSAPAGNNGFTIPASVANTDHARYKAAKDQAEAAGARLTIVDG